MPFVIPGPSTREVDYSTYVSGSSKTSLGIVGTATKGPIGVPTLCTSQSDFSAKFGGLNKDCLATYAAYEFLAEGNQLWFSRVGATDTLKSSTVKITDGAATPVDLVSFTGKTPGTGYDDMQISIKNVNATEFTADITIIDKYGRAIEKFKGVSSDKTSSNFIETALSSSKYVTVDYIPDTTVKLVEGLYTMSGGSNGTTGIKSSDYIGSSTKPAVGIATMSSSAVNINLFAIPGCVIPEVITAGLAMCETRGDALYIVDPPSTIDAQGVTDWINGAGTNSDHSAFNSSYGVCGWSWQTVYDAENDLKVLVPPSGLISAAYAYSDKASEVWYAPAGLKRGILKGVLSSEFSPTAGEQELLYNNNINPIINNPTAGIVLFGQKTLQRSPTATDRVNVRRLLLYLRKVIAATAAYLSFEPNDSTTWNEFEDLVEPVLRGIKDKRGLYDYLIQMNATTVTSDDIDEYSMPGKIYIKPTKAAEAIPIDFVLTKTGVDFTDQT